MWTGRFTVAHKTDASNIKTDTNDREIAVAFDEGATGELAQITNALVTTVPFGTVNDQVNIEAAMLVLANATVDVDYTVTIVAGATYDTETKAWSGKFTVTHKTDASNTKSDQSNRAITIVIAQGSTYYRDDDRDGYGVTDDHVYAGGPEYPYTALVGGDLDDQDSRIFPDADILDGRDNDGDGQIDEDDSAAYGLLEVTDELLGTVPYGTTNDKGSIEAAMLVLANSTFHSQYYTATIAAGSTYDPDTHVWSGKFTLTHKDNPGDTKTDTAARTITVVIDNK